MIAAKQHARIERITLPVRVVLEIPQFVPRRRLR
ncbi:MAG: hypothetical protein ACI8TL_002097, partial [Natronomonas sp.]